MSDSNYTWKLHIHQSSNKQRSILVLTSWATTGYLLRLDLIKQSAYGINRISSTGVILKNSSRSVLYDFRPIVAPKQKYWSCPVLNCYYIYHGPQISE